MRKALRFFLLFLLFGGCAGLASSEPSLSVKTQFYDVTGRSTAELRRNLNRKSPFRREGGGSYDAYTAWHVQWRFRWQDRGGACAMLTVEAAADVNFTYPRWVDKEKARPAVRRKWEHYMHALRVHENGHKSFGMRAAAEVEREISRMKSREDCETLERDANRLGHRILDRYTAMEKRYDRRTRHGATQGAVFP